MSLSKEGGKVLSKMKNGYNGKGGHQTNGCFADETSHRHCKRSLRQQSVRA